MQRVENGRIVGRIGRWSVSCTRAGASERAGRIVVAISIVVAIHGGRVGFVGA